MLKSRLAVPHRNWWLCSSTLARTPIGCPFRTESVASSGASLDPNEAFMRAFGEGVERYSAATATYTTVRAALRDTGIADRLPVCAPDEPCPPSLRALPLDTPLDHVVVRRMSDDRELLVPAELVHINFDRDPVDPPVTVPISTGSAFQHNLLAALWAGWCEVVERDALMCLWWCRSASPEIDCGEASLPDDLAERLEQLASADLRVHLFDMTTDIRIPSILCIIIAPRHPYLVVGAASHHDPVRACTKALDECVMMRYLFASHPQERRPRVIPPDDGYADVDRADGYTDRSHHLEFQFLFGRNHPRVSFNAFVRQEWWEMPEDMDALTQQRASVPPRCSMSDARVR
jgi:ribosomal protein S12 methylthiotransferase accessory factor